MASYAIPLLDQLFAVGGMPIYLLATTPFSRMIRRRAQATVAAGTVFVSTTEEIAIIAAEVAPDEEDVEAAENNPNIVNGLKKIISESS